jgi:hypothetical protein
MEWWYVWCTHTVQSISIAKTTPTPITLLEYKVETSELLPGRDSGSTYGVIKFRNARIPGSYSQRSRMVALIADARLPRRVVEAVFTIQQLALSEPHNDVLKSV